MLKLIHIKNQKLLKIALLSFFILSASCLSTNKIYADSVDFSVNVEPAIRLDIPTNLVLLNLTPTASGAFFSQDLPVSVSTNYPTGYRLYMNSENTNLSQTTPQQTANIPTLANKSGGYTISEFINNKWGYKLPSTNYLSFNGNAEIASSSDVVTEDSTTVTFATKIDTNQPAGSYELTLNFIAIPFYQTPTINDIYYMQDFRYLSDSDKATLIGSMTEGVQYQLTDARDGHKYWVSKLADGNIWMTQNLDFIIDTTKTYTHEDTDLGYTTNNIHETWQPGETLATISTISGKTVTPSFGDSYTPQPLQAEGGTQITYMTALYDDINKCIEASHTKNDCEHYHVGNYYNWAAAVASNNVSGQIEQYKTMPNSICPAGWRLPYGITQESSTLKESDFNYLFRQSGITNDIDTTGAQSLSYEENGWNNFQSSPLYFALSGGIWNGGISGKTGYPNLWTATSSNNSSRAYNLFATWSNPFPANTDPIGGGFGVRCILR